MTVAKLIQQMFWPRHENILFSPHIMPIKQESTAKVCQIRETGGQKQATAR